MSTLSNDRRIDYIEFPATDIAATKRFYSDVFGWTFVDYGPNYTSFADGRLTGGFQTAEVKRGGGALVVLCADDLSTLEGKVAATGRVIVKPIFSFPGGKRFHFTDPNGNELAVWSDK